MMSLYADYLKERTVDNIIETEWGFATYRYVDERSVYIVDIFTSPDYRKKGYASQLADMICKEAKEKGCTALIGTVQPSAKGSSDSCAVLLAYGMTLHTAAQDAIYFRKDI